MNTDIAKLMYENITSQNIKYSIVIPTYKRPQYLARTIESAVYQKDVYSAYEVIIINNDHSDCTENIEIKKIVEKFSGFFPDIRYYENTINIGQYGNWFLGISLARGNWICMCHDDDVMSSYTLACYEYTLNNPKYKNIGYIRTNFISRDIKKLDLYNKKNDKRIKTYKLEKITRKDFVIAGGHAATAPPTCGTLIRKEAAFRIGGFKQEYFPSGDAQFVFEISENYNVYRTISHMGVYGVGVNETLKTNMKQKFVETGCKQMRELKRYGKWSRLFLDFFNTAIIYKQHKIRANYETPINSYNELDFNELTAKEKFLIYTYTVISQTYFKVKKIWALF